MMRTAAVTTMTAMTMTMMKMTMITTTMATMTMMLLKMMMDIKLMTDHAADGDDRFKEIHMLLMVMIGSYQQQQQE